MLGAGRDRPRAALPDNLRDVISVAKGVADVISGPAEAVTLEATHHRRAESSGEHRRLPQRFSHPAPPWLFGDVQHGRERPGDSVHARLGGGDPSGTAYEVLVPRCGQTERDREDCAVPVDNVPPEQQWDPQP